jgi:hypothetical protein
MAHLITLYHLQRLLNVEIATEGDYEWWLGFGSERKRSISEKLVAVAVYL